MNELRRLGDLLEKEQNLYNKLNNMDKENEHVPVSFLFFMSAKFVHDIYEIFVLTSLPWILCSIMHNCFSLMTNY